MRIAVDFDDTIVVTDKPYDQIDGKFTFVQGAKEGLYALKDAGHTLLLWSARASAHQRSNWRLNPLLTRSPEPTPDALARRYALNQARFDEMVTFVKRELPGVFNAIDQGDGGKPSVDLFVDNLALRLGSSGLTWNEVAAQYGGRSG